MTTPLTPAETQSTPPTATVVQTIALPARWPLYVAIAVLGIGFALTAYFGVRSYQKQLTAADAQYQALKAKEAIDLVSLTEHTATRAAQTAQISMADSNAAKRDSDAEVLKAKIVVDNASDADVKSASDKFISPDSLQNPDGSFTYKKATVQQIAATKVDDTEVNQDKVALTAKAATLQDMVTSTAQDLSTCETDKAAGDKVILAYKKAATKSKWAKVLDVSEKVGIFGAGIVIAHELDKH